MRLKVLVLLTVVLCVVPMTALPARAETIVFSGQSAVSGNGTFNFTPGMGNSLSVSNALINSLLTSFGACIGGCGVSGGSNLNLTSAGQTAFNGTNVWTFGTGGMLTIMGGISSLGIAAGSTLLTAMFVPGATFTFNATSTSTFGGNLNLASIMLNPAIGTFNFTGGSDNQLFMNVVFAGGVFNGDVSSSAVNLQGVPVPEPAALAMLGAGLIGLAAILRRRRSHALTT